MKTQKGIFTEGNEAKKRGMRSHFGRPTCGARKQFRFLCLLLLIVPFRLSAQGPTNTNTIAASRAVTVNTNGVLAAPLDFFSKNSNALNAAVSTSVLMASNVFATNFNGGTFKGAYIGTVPGTNLTGYVPLAQIYGAGAPQDYSRNLQVAVWSNSTVFSETWANFSTWGQGGLSISNGAVYSLFQNPSAANHTFNMASSDEARIRGSFTVPAAGTSSTSAYLGLNSDAAGAVPSASLGNLFGLGLSGSGANNTLSFTGASVPNASGVNGLVFANMTVNYCVWIDSNNFSFVARWGTNNVITNEYRGYAARSAFPTVNNVEIWVGDSRGYSGIGWNQVGARKASATIAPRNNVEGQCDFVIWTTDSASPSPQQIRVWQPASYDTATNIGNLIVYVHGHGSGGVENYPWDAGGDTNISLGYFAALVASNYTVLSSALGGGDGTWGSPFSVQSIENALQWYRARFAYSNLYLIGDSAGGPTVLNFIASHQEKVSGVVLHYPVCAISNMYVSGWNANIDTAFGGGSSSEFQGMDPLYRDPRFFYGVPMRIYASSSDTIVSKALNSDLLVAKLGGTVNANVTNAAFSPEVDEIATSGNHGDDSNFQVANDVAFFNRCLTYSLNNQGVTIPSSQIAGTQWPPNVVTTNGTGQTIAQSLTLTSNLVLNAAPTFSKTNAAPSSVAIGSTAADLWLTVTNGSSSYFIPVWKNH